MPPLPRPFARPVPRPAAAPTAAAWLGALRDGGARPLRRPTVPDVVVAALLATAAVGGLFVEHIGGHTGRSPDTLGVLLALLTALPLLWRSSHSLRVLVAVTLPLLVLARLDYPSAAASLGQLAAMYSVAVARPRVPAAAALVFAEATTVLWVAIRDTHISVLDLVTNTVALFAVWAFARSVGFRRAYTAELEARAERLERTREADTRAAIAEERGRIARELHDVVAHHVSVMTVQAAAAQRMTDRDPERAREAMAAVEDTGRAALIEMRRLVGILRSDEPAASVSINEGLNAPQPGLDQLDTLVTQVRDAGVSVELSIEGPPRDLAPGVDLAAYRIVQEALTNTLKHAGPAASRVLLRFGDDELLVRVSDDGRGPGGESPAGTPERTGHGLLGMRERVSLYGGRLYAGPRADGGFEVVARIPCTEAASRATTRPTRPSQPTGSERLEQPRP